MILEGGNPEPEPTSDVTCEVMASGFGGGQEGNRETFLEGEVSKLHITNIHCESLSQFLSSLYHLFIFSYNLFSECY